jgi:hypothetical protein
MVPLTMESADGRRQAGLQLCLLAAHFQAPAPQLLLELHHAEFAQPREVRRLEARRKDATAVEVPRDANVLVAAHNYAGPPVHVEGARPASKRGLADCRQPGAQAGRGSAEAHDDQGEVVTEVFACRLSDGGQAALNRSSPRACAACCPSLPPALWLACFHFLHMFSILQLKVDLKSLATYWWRLGKGAHPRCVGRLLCFSRPTCAELKSERFIQRPILAR